MSSEYTPGTETDLLHRALIAHADNLKNHKLSVSALASLHEEIAIYRRLLKHSQGEGSLYFQLSANLLTLSRMASNDENDESDIQDWVAKFPILSELYERILRYLNTLQNQKHTAERTILSN